MHRLLAFSLLLAAACPLSAAAQNVAKLYSAEGVVERSRSDAADWSPIELGAELTAADQVRTGNASRAGVLFDTGVLVRLSSDSLLSLAGIEARESVRVAGGRAYFLSRTEREFPTIETPFVTAAVRGTEFVIEVDDAGAIVTVLGGTVEASNEHGSVVLGAGEQAITAGRSAPVKRLVADKLGVVEWSLHYPAVASLADFAPVAERGDEQFKRGFAALAAGDLETAAAAFRGQGWRSGFGRSLLAYRAGNLRGALEELRAVERGVDPLVDAYRGALFLSAGEIAGAEAALAPLPDSGPAAGLARAARAVALIARGKEEEAAPLLAATAGERTQAEFVACSYLEQSRFNLEGAYECADAALARDRENPFLLARTGELAYALGHTEEAKELLDAALAISPGEPLALTTAGFIELGSYRPREAARLFERAAASDAAAGLPRLGLGLALIKQGMLAEGRAELEKAAHLEPNDSLFRSYLGKAFFEEEREELAIEEYRRAKELDPDDPTPYLYSAYYYLSTFRPIEALWQIEESIERNDNRAVYRSRLLLDNDLGVRGGGLSEAFTALDFRQAARVEAIKSLNRNFADYSAHRLLADSYFGSGRTQAGISEALLADLLSPVNFNLLFSSGSGGAGSNEYTSLFDRPNQRTVVSAFGQSENNRIDAGVDHVQQFERAGFLLRYLAGYADGFRDNDYDRTHTMRARGAVQLTERDNLLLDSGLILSERGDTIFGIDPDVNRPGNESEFEEALLRIGYHHQFAYNSHLLGQVIYEDQKTDTVRDPALRGIELTAASMGEIVGPVFDSVMGRERVDRDAEGLRFDVQYIHDAELVSLVLGGSVLDAESEDEETTDTSGDRFGIFESLAFRSAASRDERAHRGYGYATWHLGEFVDLTTGIDYTHISRAKTTIAPPFVDGERGQSEWNPKLGATIYPSETTTVRGAWLQTVGASSLSDITRIEPSFVGGINQLFVDNPGTVNELAGIGLDQKFAKWTYFGAEATRRQIRIPQVFVTDTFDVDLDEGTFESGFSEIDTVSYSDEHTVEAYVYQVFNARTAGTVDYAFIEREDQSFDTEARTHRVRLGLTYYATNGFFYFGSAVWRHQNRFGMVEAGVEEESDFWTFNAGLGYQLPKRHGTFFVAVRNVFDQDYRYLLTTNDGDLFPDLGVRAGFVLSF